MRSIPTGARLFGAALLIYSVCPPFTSNDSYYTVPTALALLRHGTTAVDEYVASAPPASRYALECVLPESMPADPGGTLGCRGGHWYNFYSPGVPVLALPLVAAIRIVTGTLARVFPQAAAAAPHPIIAAFFSGDLVGGHAIVELLCAAFFGAIAVWLQYAIAREFLTERGAIALALLFGFGTLEWSVGSRNLSQHGLTILLLSAAIYLAIRSRVNPRLIAYSSIPLALAFTVRPSNFLAVGLFTIYVAIHCRRELGRYLLFAAPIAILFFARNLLELHRLFPRYYGVNVPTPYPPLLGFAMNLVSPSRGVLIFTPVFLFSFYGIYLAFRRRWLFPLSPYLAALLALHAMLISRYWGGHSYGPRYFSDVTPVFILFLIPPLLYWRKLAGGAQRRVAATVFVVLAGWGVFVHARGATSIAATEWSEFPVNVDEHKERVWDWSDPQFLRGLH